MSLIKEAMGEIDQTEIPTRIELSIASAEVGIEYWLNSVVLKPDVKIDKVRFNRTTNVFTIDFKRGGNGT